MTKGHSLKRALVASILVLCLCVTMLVGTTFAWFTDSVSSSGNKIASGTLKVDLELLDKTTGNWSSLKENKDPIFTYENWEPGYVDSKVLKIENEGSLALKWKAMLVSENELSKLADVIDVYVKLSETELSYPADRNLDGYTKVGNLVDFVNSIQATINGQLTAGESAYLGLAFKMQQTAGNEYQEMELGAFDIKIVATQLASESDSFDNQYDANAEYDGEITSLASLQTAFAQGGTYKLAADLSVEEADAVNGNALYYTGDKSVTIDLNGHTITGNTSNVVFRFQKSEGEENTITIMNGKIVAGDNSWSAVSVGSNAATVTNVNLINLEIESSKANDAAVRARPGSVYNITNCEINATNGAGGVIAGGGDVTITDVTVNQTGVYNWNSVALGVSSGSTMVVNSGEFNSDPEGNAKGNWVVYIMSSGGNFTVNGGDFNGTVATTANASNACGLICADRAAVVTINGGNFNSNGAILDMRNNVGTQPNPKATIAGGTFSSNPTVSGLYSSNLISVADGKTVVKTDAGYIVADMELEAVAEGLYVEKNASAKAYYVASGEGLANFNTLIRSADKKTSTKVTLIADVDFTGYTWTPVDAHYEFGFSLAEFNGNGYTISNLTVNGAAMFTRFINYQETVTFKDVTFENATVTSGSINTAIIVSHTYNNIMLDNVDVKDSTITGGYKVGALIGTVYNESSSTITATVKDCDIDNCVIKTTSYDFGTCGVIGFVYVSDNDQVVFENSTLTNTTISTSSPYYTLHAYIYYDGSNCIDEADGITVTNCQFIKL